MMSKTSLASMPSDQLLAKSAFANTHLTIPLGEITPLKSISENMKKSSKYQQVLASVMAVGLVEQLVVFADHKNGGVYYLLDGHLRLEALKDLGAKETTCLIATDDDTYTYNKKINRLASVQSINMIIRAVDLGVSPEVIGKALNLSTTTIRSKFHLLDGICDEAIKELSDKEFPSGVFLILKKMKPLRQIEAVNLMRLQKNYSIKFAKLILLSTPQEQLVTDLKKKISTVTSELLAKYERELGNLQARTKTAEDSFSQNTLQLTIIKSYITKLLENAEVVKWLANHHHAYLTEFQKITELVQLPTS